MRNVIIQNNRIKIAGLLTILAALTIPGVANADNRNFTLYGHANVSYDMITTGSANTTIDGPKAFEGVSSNRVSSNSSMVGLKASSDLGENWLAEAQLEITVGTDTGGSGGDEITGNSKASRLKSAFDRNTYLGLSNESFGRLLLGRYDTPYKMATRKLDVFADGIADSRSLLGTTVKGDQVYETYDARLSNQVLYISPQLGSFSVELGFANLTESDTNIQQPRGNALSVATMYARDGVFAALAYEAHTSTTYFKEGNVSLKENATKIGLGYNWTILNFGFVYEKSNDEYGNSLTQDLLTNPCGGQVDGANCTGHSATYFSFKIDFTDVDSAKVAYARSGQVGAAKTGTGATQFSVGLDHAFNDRTTGYFLYSSLMNDDLAKYGFSTAASSGKFSVNPTGTGGSQPSVFSLGMKLSF
ncbi:MAG: porin [Gallionella sp.]